MSVGVFINDELDEENTTKRNTYDYVTDKIIEYWKDNYPQTVVAFFYQKYSFENDNEWEWCSELADCMDSDNYECVEFLNDYCEGQTDIKNLVVVSLDDILRFYVEMHPELKGAPHSTNKCKWILYDYRTITPREHENIPNPFWRIPVRYKTELKYCPYCGKEIDYSEIEQKLREE